MLPERFETWHIQGAPDFLHAAWVMHAGTNHLLVICDGHFANGMCPAFDFGPVAEVRSYDEFSQVWSADLKATAVPATPFRIVRDSSWASQSTLASDFSRAFTHYVFVSGDCIVEVLADRAPRLAWVSADRINAAIDALVSLNGV